MQVKYPGFLLVFALGILQASWCHSLSVTAVRFDPAVKEENFKKADVEFSKSMEVKGVEISIEKDNPFVRMPLTPSKKGKGYANIRILSKRMYDLLANLNGDTSHLFKAGMPAYRISSARKLSSPYRIANVEVEFDDDLIVTFGLMRSESSGYWISYPEHFRIINRQLKREIKEAVINEGLKAVK